MLALTSLALFSLLSLSPAAVNALPLDARAAPEPVCYETYKNVSVVSYTMLKNETIFDALTLKDGVLYTPLNETISVLNETFNLVPPNVHYLEKEPQRNETEGSFEICELEEKVYLKFIKKDAPAAHRNVTQFKLCAFQGMFNVSLPERDTRGDSCTETKVFLQPFTKLPTEKGHPIKQTTPWEPFYLRAITYGKQLGYRTHKRSLEEGIPSVNGLSVNLNGAVSTGVSSPARIAIGTMFKDKAKYLNEWIAFYRMLGVSSFLLYDHGSSDNPLEVLRPYIDAGIVTYVHWPPAHADGVQPIPRGMNKLDAMAQEQFLEQAMAACLYNEWTTHTQGACQFAASVDMLRRVYDKTDLLGFLDVDEFIYPTEAAQSSSLATLFGQAPFNQADYISVLGSNFGTSGHAEAPAGLVTASYHTRRALDNDSPSPFSAGSQKFLQTAENKGALTMTFTLPETYALKAFVRPEKAIYSIVHDWVQQPSATSQWNMVEIGLDYPDIKFNHYAYLSRADANRKAQANGNPMAAYDDAQDAFYSAEEDHSIKHLLPALRKSIAGSQ